MAGCVSRISAVAHCVLLLDAVLAGSFRFVSVAAKQPVKYTTGKCRISWEFIVNLRST